MSPNTVAILQTLHTVMVDPLRVGPMPMLECSDPRKYDPSPREDRTAPPLPIYGGPIR